MVYIDAVQYTTDIHGCEVITHLKWTIHLNEKATNKCTKQQMLEYIKENPNGAKTKYLKKTVLGNRWIEGTSIHVVDNIYLCTIPNKIKKDNLENLPKF